MRTLAFRLVPARLAGFSLHAAVLFSCATRGGAQVIPDTTWLISSPGRGRVPVALELTRAFPYSGADAVLLRSPTGVPRERIVLRFPATSELLERALFLQASLHGQDSGCPSDQAVLLVSRGTAPPAPPVWAESDGRLVEEVLSRLSAELTGSLDRSQASATLWVKRTLTRAFVEANGGVFDFDTPCPFQ